MKRENFRNFEALLLIIVLLYIGRALFIPLSFALLLSFVSYPVCHYLENRHWPRSLAIAVCLLGLTIVLAIFGAILITGVLELMSEWDIIVRDFRESFDQVTQFIYERFEVTPEQQNHYWQRSGSEALSSLGSIVGSLLSFSLTSVTAFIIIPVFVALLLANREILIAALQAWLPVDRRPIGQEVLRESVRTYYEFVKGMAIVYALVGVLNSIGLALLGVPNFLFFGFLASILTFIPYFGIMIGGAVPVAIAWADSPAKALGVIAVFVVVQYLEANVIFPRAVGQRLKINTFIMLVSIVVGGILWGGAGLVIVPPLVGIIKIVADRLESWKPLAILLDTEPPETI